jgi:hypothetical protein
VPRLYRTRILVKLSVAALPGHGRYFLPARHAERPRAGLFLSDRPSRRYAVNSRAPKEPDSGPACSLQSARSHTFLEEEDS